MNLEERLQAIGQAKRNATRATEELLQAKKILQISPQYLAVKQLRDEVKLTQEILNGLLEDVVVALQPRLDERDLLRNVAEQINGRDFSSPGALGEDVTAKKQRV